MINKLPEISRITDFNDFDSIQIFAENADINTKVYVWYPQSEEKATDLTEKPLPVKPAEAAVLLFPNAACERVLYVEQSRNKVHRGLAVIWLENEAGYSAPMKANVPRIFGTSHEKIKSGRTLTVWGTNFKTGKGEQSSISCIENKETKQKVISDCLRHTGYGYNSEQYIAQIMIPQDLPDGEYEVRINGGSGGEYGWSEPVDITVSSKESLIENLRDNWNYNNKFNADVSQIISIKAPENGAFEDMSEKIQNAVDSLAKTGGIVMLSAGIFGISKTVVLKPGVTIIGAGKNNTVIKACDFCDFTQDWSDIKFASRQKNVKRWAIDWKKQVLTYRFTSLIQLTTNCGISDIGFELTQKANIGILIANTESAYTENNFINNVSVNGNGVTAYNDERGFGNYSCALYSVGFNKNLCVYNSSFKALSSITLLPGRNERIKLINNTFECYPRQVRESFVGSPYHCMFIGNDFIGGRRSLMMQCGCTGNLIYQNRSYDVARSQNALEAYMSEYGSSAWHGQACECAKEYIAVEDDLNERYGGQTVNERLGEENLYLCIMDGKGFGQYRKVVRYEYGRLYVDKPFDVVPDETTYFTLMTGTVNTIWLNNNTALSNGTSRLICGAALDNICAGHEMDMSAGIDYHPISIYKDKETDRFVISAFAFNMTVGCQSRASGQGLYMHSEHGGEDCMKVYDNIPEFILKTAGMFGNTIRKNAFGGSVGLHYKKCQGYWIHEMHNAGIVMGGAYNLVEHNRITGYTNGVHLINDCNGNYFTRNSFDGTPNRFEGFDRKVLGPDFDGRGWIGF